MDKFLDLLNKASKEVFRLETLDEYKVDEEVEEFERYRSGKYSFDKLKKISEGGLSNYLQVIKNAKDRGVNIFRIHIVTVPLTKYLKFEIETGYYISENYGEKVFLINRNDLNKVNNLNELEISDYWMFDEKYVLPIKYDKEGRFIEFQGPITENIEKYIYTKNKLLPLAKDY